MYSISRSLTRSAGKHSTKKDDFLTTIMQVPPKQRVNIVRFDSVTQRDAFSVGLDGLKGVSIIVIDSISLPTSKMRLSSGMWVRLYQKPRKPEKIEEERSAIQLLIT